MKLFKNAFMNRRMTDVNNRRIEKIQELTNLRMNFGIEECENKCKFGWTKEVTQIVYR